MEDWQRILHVRSLVLPPHLDMRTRLKFAALCRKSGRLVSRVGADGSATGWRWVFCEVVQLRMGVIHVRVKGMLGQLFYAKLVP